MQQTCAGCKEEEVSSKVNQLWYETHKVLFVVAKSLKVG